MRPRRTAVAGLLAAALATVTACSHSGNATRAAESQSQSEPTDIVFPEPPAESAAATPSAAAHQPTLTGDAASNAACKLLDVPTIENTVAAHVIEERGLTSPGSYGPKGLSCTWILDSTDIGIPAVVVQWEQPVTTWHDPLVHLYRSTVDQKLATPVPNLGDYAMIEGPDAVVIAGTQSLRVSVTVHPTPTKDDQDHAVALLRQALDQARKLS